MRFRVQRNTHSRPVTDPIRWISSSLNSILSIRELSILNLVSISTTVSLLVVRAPCMNVPVFSIMPYGQGGRGSVSRSVSFSPDRRPGDKGPLTDRLVERGVILGDGYAPRAFVDGGLVDQDGTFQKADLVLYSPPMTGPPLLKVSSCLPASVGGHIAVDKYGQVKGLDQVYAGGPPLSCRRPGGSAIALGPSTAASSPSLSRPACRGNDTAAPGHVCPGVRIHATDIVQPPGIGTPPIANMDAHRMIVTSRAGPK